MKKLLGLFFALFLVLSLSSCGDDDKVMSYSEFMAAEAGDDVVVEGFIAAKQGWWSDKVTMYLTTDTAGEGYFVYEFACSEEENNTTYAIGTYIQITAKKTIYAGEHEIMGSDITDVKVVETTKTQAKTPIDLTDKLNDLFNYQNSYFTVSLSVKEISYKGTAGEDDIYLTLTNGTKDLSCCIEYYLTGPETDVYKNVMALTVGQSVKATGYLYWWSDAEDEATVKANGANPHLVEVVVAA